VVTEQLEEGAGFPTRDHQAVDSLELFRVFHQHNFRAQFFESLAMGLKIALQRQNSDFHGSRLSFPPT